MSKLSDALGALFNRYVLNTVNGLPAKFVTSDFTDNKAARDYIKTKYATPQMQQKMWPEADVQLIARMNKKGSYDILARYDIAERPFSIAATFPEEAARITEEVRYGLSFEAAIEELDAFEEKMLAAIKTPNPADHGAYIQAHFTDHYPDNHVKRIRERFAKEAAQSEPVNAGNLSKLRRGHKPG